MMDEKYLRDLAYSNPLLAGFIRGLTGKASPPTGRTATTKPPNVYDAEWCHADKPKALPAAKPVTKD